MSINPTSADLSSWQNLLQQVVPADDTQPHKMICLVQVGNQKAEYKVYSQQEIDEFNKKHSFWNDRCVKLSFASIVQISLNRLSFQKRLAFEGRSFNYKTDFCSETLNRVQNFIHLCDTFNAQMTTDSIVNEVKSCFSCESAKEIHSALQKMYERGKKHRKDERANSIWGKVKWVIWSWFYDQRAYLQVIDKSSAITSKDVKDVALEALKERIKINIEGFEETLTSLPSGATRHTFFNEQTMNDLNTIEGINKWIAIYHPDKFKLEMGKVKYENGVQRADEHRQRVLVLRKLWKEIISIKADKVPEVKTQVDHTVLSLPPAQVR